MAYTVTATSQFEFFLLKILEKCRTIPEDPKNSFFMSLLPHIKSLDENKKTLMYLKFVYAMQRVKYSLITLTYPYNTSNNQTYSSFVPQHH